MSRFAERRVELIAPAASDIEGAGFEVSGPRILEGLLTGFLASFCVLHLVCWSTSYLKWPWAPDHDVFATLARSWDAGALPYRDMYSNNLPSTIYLYWVLGKAFGWGRTSPFFALDASLAAFLGLMMFVWSKRRLGSALPGLIGYLFFLRYYFSLDYTMAGERDWHAALLSVISIMVIQAWTGRRGRLASAIAMAFAAATRPQAVLFLPAVILALTEETDRSTRSWSTLVRRELEWALAFVFLLAVMFVPLLYSGVLGDFFMAFHSAAYGGVRDPLTPAIFFNRVLRFLLRREALITLAATLLAGALVDSALRRFAGVWLVAMMAAMIYKPISPRQHDYLDIPGYLVLAIIMSVMAGLIFDVRTVPRWLRLWSVLTVLAVSGGYEQTQKGLQWSYATFERALRGELPIVYPNGYAGDYPLGEYDEVLAYIKGRVDQRASIANALAYPLALTGPTARLSAFPAESMAWLRWVRPDDEEAFVNKLEETRESIVVWCPREFGRELSAFESLGAAIRRHYEPERRFSDIEIWRRKGRAVESK
jgi:hypothetical protein